MTNAAFPSRNNVSRGTRAAKSSRDCLSIATPEQERIYSLPIGQPCPVARVGSNGGGDMVKRTILSLVTAGAVGVTGMAATPQPANAVVWWVVPAIVGGAVLGVGVGAAAANSGPRAYAYDRDITVQPTAACHIERQRMDDGRLR